MGEEEETGRKTAFVRWWKVIETGKHCAVTKRRNQSEPTREGAEIESTGYGNWEISDPPVSPILATKLCISYITKDISQTKR